MYVQTYIKISFSLSFQNLLGISIHFHRLFRWDIEESVCTTINSTKGMAYIMSFFLMGIYCERNNEGMEFFLGWYCMLGVILV